MDRTSVTRSVCALMVMWGACAEFASAQPVRPAMPAGATMLRIGFGHKDKKPTAWDGSIRVSPGRVVGVTAQGKKGAAIVGATWKVKTRQEMNRKLKKPVIVRPVLFATLNAPPEATITIRTKQGEFSAKLGDLEIGTPKKFLKDQVYVTRVPTSARLTDEPTDDDWPTAAKAPDGTIWVAYTAYKRAGPLNAKLLHETRKFDSCVPKGHGDQVRLMRFNGKTWSAPIPVTGERLDVWRPAVAVDGAGVVWVVWSQKVGDNWDLYARGFTGGKGGKIIRLTTAPGSDLYAVTAADPKSNAVAVVWQGWRDGSFDILATFLDGGKASPEESLYSSPANEWCPAAAYDSTGSLYVAFDTYERGNYDVKLTCGAGAAKSRTIDLAATKRYEARPNIAVDARDRVWVAYEDGAVNWAKDDGGKWTGPKGERFYISREARVRCYTGAEVLQVPGLVPVEKVTAGYPRGSMPPKRRVSLPRIAFDGAGGLWLLYRRHAATAGAGERWISLATRLTAAGWTPALPLANSINLLDNRPALAAVEGGILAVHSTDGRTTGTKTAGQNDLYCSVLPSGAKAGALKLAPPPPGPTNVITVHPNEVEDIRRARAYRATVGGKEFRLLRGEFHRHTELTSHQDMDGTLEEMWRCGMDVAGFDWIGNGDHDNGYGAEYLWWLVQKQTDFLHHPPAFTPMFTYERSRTYPSGHRNAMFAYRGVRPLPQIPGGKDLVFGTPDKGSPDIKGFYAYLKHFGGICASHTSGTNMGTDWRDSDPDVEPVVEIFQGCRQSYEHEGAPATAKDAKDSIGGYRPAGFVWNAFKKGIRLGFQSSSDHYSSHISYAIVYAEDTSREAILDAFKKRHCYGANDNIILDVRCGEKMMGDIFELKGKPTLKIHAEGTLPIERLTIVRGVDREMPVYVYDGKPNKKQVDLTWTDESPAWGRENYYYVRVEQQRPAQGAGSLAWASPMWIQVSK